MTTVELCQCCHSVIASVNITRMVDGKKQILKLCEKCAQEQGELQNLTGVSDFFEKVMESIFGPEATPENTTEGRSECPACHLTLDEFEKGGLLGCSTCYEAFKSELDILLRRIHGSNKHIGSTPRPDRIISNTPDLAALKNELHEAIEHENYERAAEFRDMIRNLEREFHLHSTTE